MKGGVKVKGGEGVKLSPIVVAGSQKKMVHSSMMNKKKIFFFGCLSAVLYLQACLNIMVVKHNRSRS